MTTTSTRPAPDSTTEGLVDNARELRGLVRATADEAERLGRYTPAVHAALLDAGLYHMLTPTRYGGQEVDLRTYARVIIEIGRGDPGSSWCLSLGHGHTLTTASHWSAAGQDAVFGTDADYFRASHSLTPAGTARRVEGGWLVNADSRYQSGVPYATHATVSVQIVDDHGNLATPAGATAGPLGQSAGAPAGAPPSDPAGAPAGPPPGPLSLLQVLIPAGSFTVKDDWGADSVFGMRASGSNGVLVENVLVPLHHGAIMGAGYGVDTSPGVELHGNPLYLGAQMSFAQLNVTLPVIGAAWAALDEFEHLMRTRNTAMLGGGPRLKDPFYQRDFGAARIKAESAEAIALEVTDRYTRYCRDAVDGVRPFTLEMDMTLGSMLAEAGRLAGDAVDSLTRSAGTSALGRNQKMQRYLRDVAMYRTHYVAQYDAAAQRYGAIVLGETSTPIA